MCLALPETIYPSSPPSLHPSPQAVAQHEFPQTDGHHLNPIPSPLLNPDAPVFRFGAFDPASSPWSASQQSYSFASLPADLSTVQQHDAIHASFGQSQGYPAGMMPAACDVGGEQSISGVRAGNVAVWNDSNPHMVPIAISGRGEFKGAGEQQQRAFLRMHSVCVRPYILFLFFIFNVL